ncbi:MAG: linked oxidase protein [Moraxellaceae bacterium]|jgi:alkyldihydroxyacetonephosphate synthase|nr:linked oxidase protein [Moraxellaceae bacterium]
MRKWNGWGDSATEFPANEGVQFFLQQLLGPAEALPDAALATVLATVPVSRLPAHPLVSTAPEIRLRHARGQSLPDWLALRSGAIVHFPDGVAEPETGAQVRELLDYARQHDVTVIPYGGGTSVAGHINPLPEARPVLTLSLARLNSLIALDRESQVATIGAGASGPQVETLLNTHGYTLGHFPQSFELSTLGGWVVTRSSGQQSLRYGRIEQMFAGGTLETLQGTLDIPTFPASSAGPDLREIVLGSEGRLGVLTEVKVRVSRQPEAEEFHVFFLPDWQRASTAIREVAQSRLPLSMLRLSNAEETRTQLILAGHARSVGLLDKMLRLRGAGDGRCMMTVGVTGSRANVRFALQELKKIVRGYGAVATGQLLGKKWVANRFRAPYLRESLWQLGYAVDTLETAVDWPRVTPAINAIEAALRDGLREEGEKVMAFTHLSHLYAQGSSIYTTYLYRVGRDYAETHARWEKLKRAASEAIVQSGGTISHQHGVGRDHAPYLPAEKGELGMNALRALCQHFDPERRLNPGKLLLDE